MDTVLVVRGGAMAELDLTAGSPAPAATEPSGETVDIAGAAPDQPTATPESASTGDLRVLSSPAGATVLLDGRQVGTTPISLRGVRPGRRAVSVVRSGYETVVQQVDIRPGIQFEASIELRPVEAAVQTPPTRATPPPPPPPAAPAAPGTVEILVRPWGRIVIDGTTRQRESDTVYRTSLPAGVHQIIVSHPQLGSDERTITVQPGGVTRIEFDLARGTGGS